VTLRVAAVGVFALLLLAACDSGGTECVCPSAGLTVSLPSPLVGQVTTITGSGLACADAAVAPAPTPHVTATSFHIEPTQPGMCQIDLSFTDGTTFSDQLTVVETTGCCAGLRTSPLGAAQIDVPPPGDAAP
jgi:hypothetical protein